MFSTDRSAEKLLKDVVHELRQPLSNIETSAYLLNRMLRGSDDQACQHVCTIGRQVDLAARILSDAVAELGRLQTLRTEDENLDFTKPETAAVT